MYCRLCLIECTNENSFLLFGFDQSNVWTQLIFKYLTIKIEKNDDFSTIMCDNCYRHLSSYHNFYEYIENKQVELQNIRLAREEEQRVNSQLFLNIKTETYEEETLTEVADFSYVQPEPERTRQISVKWPQHNKKLSISQTINRESYETIYQKAQNVADLSIETLDGKGNNNDENVYDREDRTCVICNTEHKTYRGLQSHMYKLHNDAKPFSCKRCGADFRFRPNYRGHLKSKICAVLEISESHDTMHSATIKAEPNETAQNLKHQKDTVFETLGIRRNKNQTVDHELDDRTCVICNKVHKSEKGLQSHMYKIHNDVKPFRCDRCGLQFRFRPNHRSHLEDKKCADRGIVARDDIERRTCMICRKVHKSFQGLQSHIYRYHSNARPFVCSKCGVGFRFEQSLQHHLTKEKCGKTTIRKETNGYDRSKDRTCGICHRRFKNVDALSSHMYIAHKGARPFSCKTCGLKFRMKGTYLRHFWKCSGTKPTESSQISVSSDFLANSSTESIENRTCTLCTLVFDTISNLYQHMTKEHEDIKPFCCQTCGKCFILKRALEKHSERNCQNKQDIEQRSLIGA